MFMIPRQMRTGGLQENTFLSERTAKCRICLAEQRKKPFPVPDRDRQCLYPDANSTRYDQAYVPGRNVYDNVSLLVDDLFTMSLIDSGALELKSEPVDLRRMAEELERRTNEMIQQKMDARF